MRGKIDSLGCNLSDTERILEFNRILGNGANHGNDVYFLIAELAQGQGIVPCHGFALDLA